MVYKNSNDSARRQVRLLWSLLVILFSITLKYNLRYSFRVSSTLSLPQEEMYAILTLELRLFFLLTTRVVESMNF